LRKILNRYISREIWPIFIAGLLVFIFIVLAARMLSLAEWVVNRGIHLGEVIKMIAYLIPGMVLFALPAAMLMAVFIAFLRLSSDNEITAMKSSGISLGQMLPPVVVLSLVGLLVALSIGVFFLPQGNRAFKDLVFRIARSKADLSIKERIFSEPFDKVTFYVNSFSEKDRVMKNIFLVDRRDPAVTLTVIARQGEILSDPKGRAMVVHLVDGTAFTVEKKSQAARTVQFSTYDVTVGLEDILPAGSMRKRSPKEMLVMELIRNLREADPGGSLYHEMAMELMERFSIPAAVFLMGIIGALLGVQIRSGGPSLGIGISLGVFVIYYLFLAGVRSLGESGTVSPFLGMWFPPLFLLGSCLALGKRAQTEQPLWPLRGFFPKA